jgi:tape measure domain-containing protein
MTTVVEEFVAKLGWDIDSRELQTFQHQARGLKDTARSAFYGATIAATGLAAAIWKASSAFSVIEDAEAAFTPLLGGAERAATMVERLNTMAAKTPFEFADLAGATKQLLPSMGGDIDQTIASIQMLGDAAQGNAQKMQSVVRGYNRILIKGKANLEGLNVIAEAGVPIYDELTKTLGFKNGKAMFDAVSAGKVSAEDVTKTFKAMTSEGGIFFRGMEIASKTLSGKISTLRDDATMALAAIGKELSPTLKDVVDELSGVAQSVEKWVKANGALIRVKFREYVGDVRDIIKSIVSFGRGLKSVIDGVGGLGNAFKIVAGVVVGVKLVPFLSTLNGIIEAAPSLGTALAAASSKALLTWGKMGFVFGAMYLILDDIAVGLKGGISYTGKASKQMTEYMDSVTKWYATMKGLNIDAFYYQMSQLPMFQRGLVETLKVGAIGTKDAIVSILGTIGDVLYELVVRPIQNAIYDVIGFFGRAIEIIMAMMPKPVRDFFFDKANTPSGIKSQFNFVNPFSLGGVYTKKEHKATIRRRPRPQVTISGKQYSWAPQMTINIPVKTNAMASDIAKAVEHAIERTMKSSYDNFVAETGE